MAQIAYRANLSSAVFPMTLADAGRTVINPQADQNFDRRVDPAGEQKDAGIPQAIYLENVIPTVNGYQSVGYRARTVLPAKSAGSGAVTVNHAFVVDDAIILAREGTAGYEDVVSNFVDCSGTWQYQSGATVPTGDTHSIATVRGTHYWCDQSSLFTFTVNAGTKQVTFVDVTGSVTGITVSDIVAICSAYNYLVALMADGSVAWSSTTTPTDFTPSLVTGAGSETPAGASNPVFLKEHPAGFYVYCEESAVFAAYTGNARYPWKFVPVANAGGYSTSKQAFGSYFSAAQYGIDNSNKIQIISESSAQLVAPEITTYLERKKYRDTFDYSLNTFSRATGTLATAITYIQDRYIIVSFNYSNSNNYNYAFIYDTLLQRYGTLEIDHTWIVANTTTVTFIPASQGATPYTWSLDIYDTNATFAGVLFLGKFQLIRERNLQLNAIEIESAQNASYITRNFSLLLFPSLDGKNFSTPVTLTPTYTNELIVADVRNTAVNHSIMLKGAFDVNTLQLRFRVAGDR